MDSTFMAGKRNYARRLVSAALDFWIAFTLLNVPAHTFIGVFERRPISSVERVHRAVSKIENVGVGYYGAAFAIGRKYFLAAFYTWICLLKKGRSMKDIHLVQKGNGQTLAVSRLLAVSATYDLALFEINGSVKDYLGLAKGFTLGRGERLYALGYRGGALLKAAPKSRGGSYYQNDSVYGFAANHTDLRGMRAGPLFDARGKVVGLQSTANENMLYGVRSIHLHGLLTYGVGILCPRPRAPASCLRAGKGNAGKMAKAGNAVARYQLGRGDSSVNETERERAESLDWIKESTRNGFPFAMRELANLMVYGRRGVEKDLVSAASLYERASARGEPAATYTLM